MKVKRDKRTITARLDEVGPGVVFLHKDHAYMKATVKGEGTGKSEFVYALDIERGNVITLYSDHVVIIKQHAFYDLEG